MALTGEGIHIRILQSIDGLLVDARLERFFLSRELFWNGRKSRDMLKTIYIECWPHLIVAQVLHLDRRPMERGDGLLLADGAHVPGDILIARVEVANADLDGTRSHERCGCHCVESE